MDFELADITIDCIHEVVKASRVKISGKQRSDFNLSRLIVACSQGDLLSAYNRFVSLMDAPIEVINPDMIEVSANSDAMQILQWIREQPRIVLMLGDQPQAIREAAISSYTSHINDFTPIPKRPSFDINIRAQVLQALSHGDDIKAGNNTLFRRCSVGGGVRLPYYSANAIGHSIREALADHFLSSLGFQLNKNSDQFDVWFFHLMYSAGVLGEGAVPKEFEALLQGAGAGGVKSNGVRQLREMFPWFSMLGGVAKAPIEGKVSIYDLRPECIEWGNGTTPVSELFDWRFQVRMDRYEGRISKADAKKAERQDGNISLPVNTEVLKEGTFLEGGINISRFAIPLEISALAKGLEIIKENGGFGGKKRRGYGMLKIEFTDKDGKPYILDSTDYTDYLSENKEKILQYIKDIGANPTGV